MNSQPRGHADKLFFILGRGRSGTTLLVQLLDAHPSVAMAPEALFVVSLFRRYRRATWDAACIKHFCRDLWHEERLRNWRLDRRAVEQQLLSSARNGYAEMCAQVYAAAAGGRGKGSATRLGDKNPHYALFVPTLRTVFPRAQFVHLIRDYRDTIASYRAVPFDASSVPALAVRWCLYNAAVLEASDRDPAQFLRVRYEDLVADPENSLRAVCSFLGIEWTPAMIADRKPPYYGVVDWHQKLAEPIDAARAGRWRAALTPREVGIADVICQPLGSMFGYAPESDRPAHLGGRARLELSAGRLMTLSERAVMTVPLALRTAILRAYRRKADHQVD